MIYKNGDIYIGKFKNNKKNGTGKYIFSEENKELKEYNGDFLDDNRHGFGVLLFKNKNEYKGEFIENKFQGQGEFIWAHDGSSYAGFWKNDLKDKYGHFKWPDGDHYVGEIENEKPKGVGIYYDKNHERYEG
jgi:hypothetical protein